MWAQNKYFTIKFIVDIAYPDGCIKYDDYQSWMHWLHAISKMFPYSRFPKALIDALKAKNNSTLTDALKTFERKGTLEVYIWERQYNKRQQHKERYIIWKEKNDQNTVLQKNSTHIV